MGESRDVRRRSFLVGAGLVGSGFLFALWIGYGVASGRGESGRAAEGASTRPRRGRAWALLVAALMLVGSAPGTAAHQGWFNLDGSPDPERPYRLPTDLTVSQVVFGDFAAPGQVDYYGFAAPAGFAVDAHVVVPDVPACERFRPVLVLIGAGLTTGAESPAIARGSFPRGFPTPIPGSANVVGAGDDWDPLYEPFTGTTFLVGPPLRQGLAGGDYLIAVFDPAGGSDSFNLSFAGAELPGGDPAFAEKYSEWERCEPAAVPNATPAT